MKVLVVGDSYYGSHEFRDALALGPGYQVEYSDVAEDPSFVPRNESERRIREFEGNPDQVAAALSDHEILVVHGAPVTQRVLEASPKLRLVCCARGGPVNVDVKTADAMGIEVVNTPGKNAAAVADLTLAFVIMLARSIGPALFELRKDGRLLSTFDGARYFGRELSGMHIGLIGFGRVGQEMCSRALAVGMGVSVYDPFVSSAEIRNAGAKPADLEELVAQVDVVSLHARETADNRGFINADLLRQFKEGAYLINTAREGLVDETALLAAVNSGRLAGVAVDMFQHEGPISQAIVSGDGRFIALPHIGGATYDTFDRAIGMISDHIEEFART